MKISLKWLQHLVDLGPSDLDPELIAGSLTAVGLAVETIEPGSSDVIFNLDITSNRPDCLSHLGVARELATKFRTKLRALDLTAPESGTDPVTDPAATIRIDAPDLCPRYAGRIITGIAVAPSPDWLKERLEAIGQRPINNVVDVTNYVLFEIGHPLHAFDLSRLEGRRIVVRRARPGECIRTLDGVLREPDAEMLMICDAGNPVAVAGVMGGESSEIHSGSTTILLESAYFTPASIRRTSKRLGLSTEASYRFERGADPEIPVKALNLATRLITEVCGGRCAGPVMDVNPIAFRRKSVHLRASRVKRLLGLEVAPAAIDEILVSLDFKVAKEGPDTWNVEVPGFRGDVNLEADLIEEVARHYGYDRIPSSYPRPGRPGIPLATDRREKALSEGLVSCGFFQAVTYSFSSPAKESSILGAVAPMIAISNPLTDVDTHLRTSLLPGLLESARHNLNLGERSIRLFEIGRTYHPRLENGPTPADEKAMLGILAMGDFYSPYWSEASESLGFFQFKGILQTVLERVGVSCAYEVEDRFSFLHPGVAARLTLHGQALGFAGELHPRVREEGKFPDRVFYAEIELDRIYGLPEAESQFTAPGRFPIVERDISFFLDKTIRFSTIEKAVQALEIPELVCFRLIDLYRGQSLPQGKVSLSVRFTFEAPDRTLTHTEVGECVSRVVGALREQFAIEQR